MSADISPDPSFPFDQATSTLPFPFQLSLAGLVALWARDAASASPLERAVAAIVQDALRDAPELGRPIEDLTVIARHRKLVELLLSKVIPAAPAENEPVAALLPFQLRAFQATPAFRHLFLDETGGVRGRIGADPRTVSIARLSRAYEVVLRQCYGIEVAFGYPTILMITDPATGLDRHFRFELDSRFVEVEPLGPLPTLTAEERQQVRARFGDPEALMALLPPHRFRLRGLSLLRVADVTVQEVLSGLKRDLIERESIVSPTRFASLETRLCTLLGQPDLRLGVAAIQGEDVLVLNHGCRLQHGCIFADSTHRRVSDFAGSVYEQAVVQGRPLVVEDLATLPVRGHVEEALLASGLRSLIVAPLAYENRTIGTLELSSARAGALDTLAAVRLGEVLPLFAMAVRRATAELEARVQAVIKEQCTAIHRSVEWRFRQAALAGIARRTAGSGTEMEAIVFRDVHPLFAESDIRDSSARRHAAVRADLLAHLDAARQVVEAARDARSLPVLDELAFRIGKHAARVERELGSGDDLAVLGFVRQHVEPLFDHLAGFRPEVAERVRTYRAALDPRLGTVYRERRDHEESVTLVADTISTYLDAEEEIAQGMAPHYFEKQRTDGVDYTIYVGAALVEDGRFEPLYLRNLRLWQLMVTCGIARRVHALRGQLRAPLDVTHLVLVQHAPLSIRFRFDERRFDVDGAYDIRYEVIKKRIDKAVIRGTTERLTQPGRIAIVYSQAAEAQEYREYLEYLRARGYLTGSTEEHELGELQGVQGLRALRVTVDLSEADPDRALARTGVAGRATTPVR